MKRTKGTVERFGPDWVRMIPRWLARGIWDTIEEGLTGGEHAGTREQQRRRNQIDNGALNECGRGLVHIHDGALVRHEQRRDDRIAKTEELQRDRARAISERIAASRPDEQEHEARADIEGAGSGEGGSGADADNVPRDSGRSRVRVVDGGDPDGGDPDRNQHGVPEEPKPEPEV